MNAATNHCSKFRPIAFGLALLAMLTSASAVTGSGLSANLTVDTRGTPTATTITVTGRILNQTTGLALAGATVSLAGRTTTTTANGSFSLADVDLATGSTATVSLSDYLSRSQTVTATADVKSVSLPDIRLSAANTALPVVEWIRPDITGAFLPGWGLRFTGKTRVNWNGNTPNSVKFYANGGLVASLSGPGPEYSTSFSVDTLFTPSLQPGRNKVAVVATSASGAVSSRASIDVLVLPIPSTLSAFMIDPANIEKDGNKLSLALKWPEPALRKTVSLPLLGTFGADVQVEGKFEYSLSTGRYEFEVGAGGDDVRKGAKVLLGNKEIGISIGATGEGVASASQGIRLDTLSLYAGLSYSDEFELARLGVLDLLGPGSTTALSRIPGLNALLKPTSVALVLKPDLSGLAYFDLIPAVGFDRFELEGKLALEATYEIDLWWVGAKVYVGGEPSVAFQIPGDLFKQIGFRAYAGLEATFGSLTLPFEYVFVEYTYPASASALHFSGRGMPPLKDGQVLEAAGNATATWRAMPRPWREAGDERFLLAPAKAAPGMAATLAGSPALEQFRRMANIPARGVAGPAVARIVADDPGLPAQATLPLLQNVFPNSAPSLAGRNAELMLLYVRDTGAANPVQFTAIAFTHFDGTNWSTPAAVAADPRGQFAPQVVFDGTGRAVAVWEQIKDAAFTDTDLTAMAAQMEILTAMWDPATESWTAPVALSDNAVLDHRPRLAGLLADGGLLLTWIQNDSNLLTGTGAPGAATNSRVMTSRWDSTAAIWSAPSTLVPDLANELSDSLAAAGNKAVYLWSKDGDGNLDNLADAELFYRIYNAATGLWEAETRYTSDALPDKNAKLVLDSAGGVYAVWQRGNDLVMDRDFLNAPAAVRADSTTLGFADFALTLGPGGNVLAIWQEMSAAGSDAHFRVFDPASDTWSLDTFLSNDAALERSFAPVWDAAGNLVLAYNNVEITKQTKTVALAGGGTIDVPGVPQPGRVDLLVARRALVKDLGFGGAGVTATGTTFLAGDSVTLKAKVRNTGNVAVQDAQVAFYDGDPGAGGTLIQTVTIPGWLKASDEQEVSVDWTVPSPTAAHTAFAVIDPGGQVTEFSETNNTSSLALNGVDLQLEYVSGTVLHDGSVRVVARVKNIGAPASPVTSVKLWPGVTPGANSLGAVEASLLNPGDSVDIAIELPAGSHAVGESGYRLVVDDEDAAGDIDRTNNQAVFSLQSPRLPVVIDDRVISYGEAVTFDPRANDADGETLTITALGAAGVGTVTTTGTSVTYTPGFGYRGHDTFTYTVNDGTGGLATARVTVEGPQVTGVGVYRGVLFAGGTVPAGFWQVRVTKGGAFSGALLIGGKRYSVSGKFDRDGKFTKTFLFSKGPTLTVALTLLPGSNGLLGTVSDGTTTWNLALARTNPLFTAKQPATQTGAFTMLLPVDPAHAGDGSYPQGIGWATMVVASNGSVRVAGKLADGASLAFGSTIDNSGRVPLFKLLYGSPKGFIAGQIVFRDIPGHSDADGRLRWEKPEQRNAQLYRSGFGTDVACTVSAYPGVGRLGWGGLLTLSRDDLVAPLTKTVTLPVKTGPLVFAVSAADKLVGSLNAKTGAITGSFVPGALINPVDPKKRSMNGVLFPKTSKAAGLFFGPSATGRMEIDLTVGP